MKAIIILSMPLIMVLHSILFDYIKYRFSEKKSSEIMKSDIGCFVGRREYK